MKLTIIRASAGCTIPHPHESFSNIKLFLELNAELADGENPHAAAIQLQHEVNFLLANERTKRLGDLQREYEEAEARRRAQYEKQQAIREAENAVHQAEQKLEALRTGAPTDDDIPF